MMNRSLMQCDRYDAAQGRRSPNPLRWFLLGEDGVVCSRRCLTTEEEARGHYGIERRGPDSGEVSGTLGGESVRISEDCSTSGLFRDDNYGRSSSGEGQSSPSNHSWNGDNGRHSELYEGAAESESTTRSAGGVDTVIESPPSSAGATAGSSVPQSGPVSPVRRRLITM